MAAVTSAGNLWDTNAGNHAVTATPAVGDLIVVIAANTGRGTANAPTITDNNTGAAGTYTQVQANTKNTSADSLWFFIRNDLIRSATSTIFTATQSGDTGGGLQVYRISGMWKAGLAAKLKSGGLSNQAAATPAITYTGGGAGLTANPKFGAIFNATNPSVTNKPASFDQENSKTGWNAPASGIETCKDDVGNTDTTVTWAASSASAWCGGILELDSTPDAPYIFGGRFRDTMALQAMNRAGNF